MVDQADIQRVVDSLNLAVQADWQSMMKVIGLRHNCNTQLLEHPHVICTLDGQNQPVVGALGLVNGVLQALMGEDGMIEATVDETGDLTGFRLRGTHDSHDYRSVPMSQLTQGHTYRVTDAVGHMWQGVYVGSQHQGEQGVYLRLSDDRIARIYFHDVRRIITA